MFAPLASPLRKIGLRAENFIVQRDLNPFSDQFREEFFVVSTTAIRHVISGNKFRILTYLLWNFLPHTRQTFNGVAVSASFLCTFVMWFFKFAFLVKLIGQPSTVHSKIRSLVCCLRCARSDCLLKNFLQIWHSIFTLESWSTGSWCSTSWNRSSACEFVLLGNEISLKILIKSKVLESSPELA